MEWTGKEKKALGSILKQRMGGGGGWISTFLMEAGTTSGCLQTVVQREAFLCREFHIKVSNRNKSTKKKKKEEEKKKERKTTCIRLSAAYSFFFFFK